VGEAAARGVPLLGVCLGHQALVAAFGGAVVRGRRPVHGKTSPVRHDGSGLFEDLPDPLTAMRYHSLVAAAPLPACLRPCAWTDDDERVPMAVSHRDLPLFGVQFHPESYLTPEGPRLLARFLGIARAGVRGSGRESVRGAAAAARPTVPHPTGTR
jgi:anthranilate synthase/aminodeoxychorismate synthase-like glutamine amidotransferase